MRVSTRIRSLGTAGNRVVQSLVVSLMALPTFFAAFFEACPTALAASRVVCPTSRVTSRVVWPTARPADLNSAQALDVSRSHLNIA